MRTTSDVAEATETPARGHTPDEDAGIGGMVLHADAVAEQRATREGAGGIDGDDRDPLPLRAERSGEGVDDRAFARARGAGDADGVAAAGAGMQLAKERIPLGLTVLHERDDARHRLVRPGQSVVEQRHV